MESLFEEYIGQQKSATCEIYAEPIERMNATFGWEHQTYTKGEPIPPGTTILFFLDAPTPDETKVDGHRKLGAFFPPITLPRRMAAGIRYQFHQPLHIGDTVTKITTIHSIQQKQGQTGSLYFLTLQHQYTVKNEVCITEMQDIVYRDEPKEAIKPQFPKVHLEGDDEMFLEPDPVLLFRYSALTFNGHRIHYDLDYAKTEGYHNLVFHGPMTASILLHWACAKLGEEQIQSYQIRFVAPLFVDDKIRFVCKQNSNNDYSFWAVHPQGHIAAKAIATKLCLTSN